MPRKILTLCAVVALSLLAAEGMLQLASLSPHLKAVIDGTIPPRLIDDARLGMRGNAEHPEHDAWGYRNAERPARAVVVAMGDSQTYGTGVARDEAWPAVLGHSLGADVYNMAQASFGAPHHWLEIERALSLQPRAVLLALYLGNDFYDAYVLSSENPQVGALVRSDLRPQADRLEQEEPLQAVSDRVFGRAKKADRLPPLRRLLSDYSATYRFGSTLLRQLRQADRPKTLSRDFDVAAEGLSPERRAFVSPHEDEEWRTILTAPYRQRVVDDRDPRIRIGVDVSREALRRVAERCREAGVRLIAVFVPTKEKVFAARVARPSAHDGLVELMANERRLKRELVDDLDAWGVEHVDLLPALRASSEQPYPEDLDGHPNAHGHEVIAAALRTRIEPIVALAADDDS